MNQKLIYLFNVMQNKTLLKNLHNSVFDVF